MKTTPELTLNVDHHGWERKTIFHSILPNTALNSIFLLVYLIEKHQSSILYQETFITKDLN